MGTSALWASARDAEAVREAFGRFGIRERAGQERWFLALAELVPFSDAVDVMDVMHQTHTHALLGLLEDSDYATVVFAGHDSPGPDLIVVNETSAAEYGDGARALLMCRQRWGRDWILPGSRAFAEWSKGAPRRARDRDIARLLRKDWTYAEEALAELWSKLGLPNDDRGERGVFEGAIDLDDRGKVFRGGVTVDLSRQRFVMGRGEGYWGIWDRKNPGPPIERFAGEGVAARLAALDALLRITGH